MCIECTLITTCLDYYILLEGVTLDKIGCFACLDKIGHFCMLKWLFQTRQGGNIKKQGSPAYIECSMITPGDYFLYETIILDKIQHF